MKYFIFTICGIVLVVVIAGFFFAGSPQKARLIKLDDARLGNLQQIQYEIINYWQGKGHLPEKLVDLEDATRGVIVPTDPEKGNEYEYKITGDLSFELCTEFAQEGDSEFGITMPARPMMYPSKGIDSQNNVWHHGAGHACFSRTIDKDFYPVLPKGDVKK